MERFIIIIWHQAGQKNNSAIYYTLTDENENTIVFASETEAKDYWANCHTNNFHAAFIVNATTSENEWI